MLIAALFCHLVKRTERDVRRQARTFLRALFWVLDTPRSLNCDTDTKREAKRLRGNQATFEPSAAGHFFDTGVFTPLLAATVQFLRKFSDYDDFAESMAEVRSIPPLRVDSRGGSRDAAISFPTRTASKKARNWRSWAESRTKAAATSHWRPRGIRFMKLPRLICLRVAQALLFTAPIWLSPSLGAAEGIQFRKPGGAAAPANNSLQFRSVTANDAPAESASKTAASTPTVQQVAKPLATAARPLPAPIVQQAPAKSAARPVFAQPESFIAAASV